MDLYKIKKDTLEPIDRDPFKLEKEIQTVVESNIETLFGIEFVKSEFSLGGFRLDSICFDNETNSFVIIEYKKGSSYSVIDQGYSYLSLMLNNKSDFILEYNETKNKTLKRNDVDWSQSRIIFISPSFSSYQKNSVNFKDVPFELWEIKRFSNGTIGLDQHLSSSEESIQKIDGNKNSVIKKVGKEVITYVEETPLGKIDQSLKDLYYEFRERVVDWDEMRIVPKKHYIGFWKGNKGKFYIGPQKKQLKIEIFSRIDYGGNVKSVKNKFTLDDPKNLFTLKKDKYRETFLFNYRDNKDLDYLILMLKQKYDS